jgi:hypothetical protein
MRVETNQHEQQAMVPASASEMLAQVHRDLVQIHAAMAERTSGDREIKGWAQRELMDIIREIGAFRRARQAQSEAE